MKWLINLFKSLIGKIFSFISKIFGDLKMLLVLAVVLCVLCPAILPAIATYFGASPGLVAVFSAAADGLLALGIYGQGALAVGAAFIIAPEETAEVVTDVAEALGNAAGSLAGGLVDGLGSSKLFGKVLPVALGIGAACGLAYWWSGRDDKESSTELAVNSEVGNSVTTKQKDSKNLEATQRSIQTSDEGDELNDSFETVPG